jgi:ELWxxDGT repeat protein
MSKPPTDRAAVARVSRRRGSRLSTTTDRVIAASVEALEPRQMLAVAMVKDISSGTAASNPTNITAVGDLAYFVATDSTHGTELWRSDGTAAGTSIVSDIVPGTGSSMPAQLAALGDTLFFIATDTAGGREVWKVDPATGDASQLKDVIPGATGSNPSSLIATGDVLYFAADTANDGRCLFKSDGTAAGTVAILAPSSQVLYPRELTGVNGMLFFVADEGEGTNLYRYRDGDTAPTGLIDVSLSPSHTLTASGDLLYFIWQETDPTTGEGMLNKCVYKSDGTPEGTFEVYVGDETSNSEVFVRGASHTGQLFFVEGFDYLQTLDRTSWEPRTLGEVASFDDMAAVGDRTYYAGRLINDPPDPDGQALYVIDAAAQSATFVQSFNPYTAYSGTSNIESMVDVNGTLYFSAVDPIGGRELWRSDGTTAGTVQVADIDAGNGDSSPSGMTYVDGKVFFSADNGSQGRELWTVTAPAQPTNVVVSRLGSTSLSLSWDDNASDEMGYEIEGSTDGSHFESLTRTSSNGQYAPLTALTPNTDYTFRLRATRDVSSPWTIVTAHTLSPGVPVAPSNLIATYTDQGVKLTWADDSDSEVGFTIEKQGAGGNWENVTTINQQDVTTYTDPSGGSGTGATADPTYRVVALGVAPAGGGTSSPGTPASASREPTGDFMKVYGENAATYVDSEWGPMTDYTDPNTGETSQVLDYQPNGSITLTLKHLPRHTHVSAYIYVETSMPAEDDDGQASIEFAVGGTTFGGGFGASQLVPDGDGTWTLNRSYYIDGAALALEHSASDLTITITGSGFSSRSSWVRGREEISTFLPFVSLSGGGGASWEGDEPEIRVVRSGSEQFWDKPLDVRLDVSGTADAGSDYTGAPPQVRIRASQAIATVVISTVLDLLSEVTEDIALAVQPSSKHGAGTPATTQTSINDFSTRMAGRIAQEEGRSKHVYDDTANPPNKTIGIGHNMGPAGTDIGKADFERVTGANFANVKAGTTDLTDDQIDKLFQSDLQKYIAQARREVGNFDKLPVEAKEVVVDLCFNMGSLSKFKDFKEDLGKMAFRWAAWDLGHKSRAQNSEDSAYKTQVPNRADRNIQLLESLADDRHEPALFP